MNLFFKPEVEIALIIIFFFFEMNTQLLFEKFFTQELESFRKNGPYSMEENDITFGVLITSFLMKPTPSY